MKPFVLLIWVALLVGSAGCGPVELDTTYGRRRGAEGGESVNGTGVLAEMYRQAGYQVLTWRRLSPKLEEADVIVWAPDSFEPPSDEQRAWFESWLWNQNGRKLVYIGRDYDSAVSYWQRVHSTAPPEQAVEVARRLAEAQSAHAARRAARPVEETADWFVLRAAALRQVRTLAGVWSSGVDASHVEIEIATRLETPGEEAIEAWMRRADGPDDSRPIYESLLTSGDEILVLSVRMPQWDNSRMLLVANGSFLLNLPLVNHEHRKLAAKLVDSTGRPGRVVFLESGPGGPPILNVDPDANYPTGLEMFTVWPLGVIVLHLAALGIAVAIAYFPIFGRARSWEVASTSDFGQHVTAVGELLQQTGDTSYALQRLKYYHDHVRRESGISHRAEPTKPPVRGA